jgi:hypothetical protein
MEDCRCSRCVGHDCFKMEESLCLIAKDVSIRNMNRVNAQGDCLTDHRKQAMDHAIAPTMRLNDVYSPFAKGIIPLLQCFCGLTVGHDWFNGGEHCPDCHKPRPKGWKP